MGREVGVFLVVGATCAAANFGSGALIRHLRGPGPLDYEASVVGGFIVGTVLSFMLNRRFTFRVDDEPMLPQAVRFALAALTGMALSALLAPVLLRLVRAIAPSGLTPELAEELGHFATIGAVTVFSFVAIKFFALRPAAARGSEPPKGAVVSADSTT